AVNVELEQRRGMIGGPASRQRLHTVKPQIGQIERLDEHIDRTNRIALFNPVPEAFRQQRRLPAIHPSNEACHLSPRQFSKGIITWRVFSHGLDLLWTRWRN